MTEGGDSGVTERSILRDGSVVAIVVLQKKYGRCFVYEHVNYKMNRKADSEVSGDAITGHARTWRSPTLWAAIVDSIPAVRIVFVFRKVFGRESSLRQAARAAVSKSMYDFKSIFATEALKVCSETPVSPTVGDYRFADNHRCEIYLRYQLSVSRYLYSDKVSIF